MAHNGIIIFALMRLISALVSAIIGIPFMYLKKVPATMKD
jgi:hypothetical protein